MRIPFVDIPLQNRPLMEQLHAAFEEIHATGAYVLGPAVAQFERAFAEFLDVSHVIGVGTGTDALHLSVQASDIGPGDEVITTPHSWISTAWAISYVGAKPVFADIDEKTYTLSPAKVEEVITPRTKAIIPVHLYGRVAEMDGLADIAQRHNVALLEDACQAHGAKYHGRSVGTIGLSGCFSFYPAKNLGAMGEAGAIATNDDKLARRVRQLRDHAQSSRHNHEEIGYNARMDGLQGAALNVKLPHLHRWNSLRRKHAQRYKQLLSDTPGLVLPDAGAEGEHVWHLYVVQLTDMPREVFQSRLAEEGVASSVHYPTPIPLQPAYLSLGHQAGDFPVAESVMNRCVSLPMYPEMTEEQVDYVAAVVKRALTSKAPASQKPIPQ